MTAPFALSAQDLAVSRGGRPVFSGLSFQVDAGAALRLAGPNGGGKSTVLRVIAGLLRPHRGRVLWGDTPVSDDWDAHAGRLAYLGHADALKPALTAWENAAVALAVTGRTTNRLAGAFTALDLDRLADLPAGWLSAGQRRRVALARVLAAGVPLWLLDEPTVGLDAASVKALERAIADHRSGGGSVVAATHIALDLGGDDESLDPAAFAGGAETSGVEAWA